MGKAEKKRESWQERRKKIKHKWAVPFILIEWNCERLSGLLRRWALLEILEYAGRLTILVAVIFYIRGCDERRMQAESERQQAVDQRKAKHYQAWQVITAAQGQRSSGGRLDALQDLNRDGISLRGIDISKAYLRKLDLAGASLLGANLAEAYLQGANLTRAYLNSANLTGADLALANLARARLFSADLTGAFLGNANLTEANLGDANLAEAYLLGTNLTRADLNRANLTGAKLTYADCTEANFRIADFTGANLEGADLTNVEGWQHIASMKYARIYDVKNPPEGFIEWAKEHGAVSIENEDEWKKLIDEKKRQEAEKGKGNQNRTGEK